MYKISVFDSGLRLITYEMPHMESASVGVWAGAGGRSESADVNGISHLLEHMVFKGTLNRNSRQIYQDIEQVGGSINAFTAEELTCYTAKVPAAYCDTAIDILSDLYQRPLFNAEDLVKEKKVINEEIHMYRDMPGQHVQDILFSVLWPDHPLGRILIGTEESVGAITPAALAAYRDRMYSMKNTVVSVAGKVSHHAVEKALQKFFPREESRPAPELDPVRTVQRAPSCTAVVKKTEQAYLCFGIRAYKREHPRTFALKLLSIILGESAGSRLFQEVRETHGLAYDIQTSIEKFIDAGTLVINVGTDKKKALDCMNIILRELGKLKKEPVTAQELDTAKQYCLGQLAMSVEKTFDHMLWMGENMLTTSRVLTVPELVEGFRRVTAEDILEAAGELFVDENLCLSAIGPLPKKNVIMDRLHY
ncbi:MAG TPA: pitrilysin family protein [bacterium]|nr:pitrilysin family protein [bacterium]